MKGAQVPPRTPPQSQSGEFCPSPRNTDGLQVGESGSSMENLDDQLLDACGQGDRKEVARLLRKGANIEARDEQGQFTPLHLACMQGNKSVVTLLLGKGAAVDARDDDERTPLHAASIKGHAAVVASGGGRGGDRCKR